MSDVCPISYRPLGGERQRRRKRQLVRQINALQREILAIEEGHLKDTMKHQAPAPACTLCSQAAPGKPGQPTTAADLVRPLRQRLDNLEIELIRLTTANRG